MVARARLTAAGKITLLRKYGSRKYTGGGDRSQSPDDRVAAYNTVARKGKTEGRVHSFMLTAFKKQRQAGDPSGGGGNLFLRVKKLRQSSLAAHCFGAQHRGTNTMLQERHWMQTACSSEYRHHYGTTHVLRSTSTTSIGTRGGAMDSVKCQSAVAGLSTRSGHFCRRPRHFNMYSSKISDKQARGTPLPLAATMYS